MLDELENIVNDIKIYIQGLWQSFTNTLSTWADDISSGYHSIMDWLDTEVKDILAPIGDFISNVWDYMQNLLTNTYTNIIEYFKGWYDKFHNEYEQLVAHVYEEIYRIVYSFQAGVRDLQNSIIVMVSGFSQDMQDFIASVGEPLEHYFDTILQYMGDIFTFTENDVILWVGKLFTILSHVNDIAQRTIIGTVPR